MEKGINIVVQLFQILDQMINLGLSILPIKQVQGGGGPGTFPKLYHVI